MVFAGACAPSGWTTVNPWTDFWAGYQIPASSGGSYTWTQTGAGDPWSSFVVTVASVAITLVGQSALTAGSQTSPYAMGRVSAGGNTLIITGHLFNNGGGSGVHTLPTSITDNAAGGSNVWKYSVANAQNPPLNEFGSGVNWSATLFLVRKRQGDNISFVCFQS